MSSDPNPWNEFRKRHAGKGLTMAQLSEMYKSEAMDFASTIDQHAELYSTARHYPHEEVKFVQVDKIPNPFLLPHATARFRAAGQPLPKGFNLGSSLYQKRKAALAKPSGEQ